MIKENQGLRILWASILFLLASTACAEPSNPQPKTAALPSDSIYHLAVSLEDQSGSFAGLNQYRGQPVLVTMFYASCPHVCPMLISTLKRTEAKLPEDQRNKLRVLAISVDPEKDTPAALMKVFERHTLDADRWSLVRPDAESVRSIAAILGVKYKQLPDGEFSHSTKILLLNSQGSPIAHSTQISRIDEEFLAAIRENLSE